MEEQTENSKKNEGTEKENTKSRKITKDMTMMEIIVEYPETMDVLLESGLHCVGCGVSQYETLEQGVMVHGWDEEDLDYLLDRLNEVVENNTGKDESKDGKMDQMKNTDNNTNNTED